MPGPRVDPVLLSRIEDAGLNASAPPQQRWLDGWLLRTLPGKARRARCVNALAPGLLPLDERLALAEAACRAAEVPLIFRITPFTQPPTLDEELGARGFARVDPTLVMIRQPAPGPCPRPIPPGLVLGTLDGAQFAQAVGALRGSTSAQIASHGLRLVHAPVTYRGMALARADDGQILACGQIAVEPPMAGLYDIHTLAEARGQGLARLLCEHLLSLGATMGGKTAYLQVDAANAAALSVYQGLGFSEAYGYHYRER